MKKRTNVTIYMKSGNKITADNVIDWRVKYNSDNITSFMLHQEEKCKNRVVIETIDLKQIECIVEH